MLLQTFGLIRTIIGRHRSIQLWDIFRAEELASSTANFVYSETKFRSPGSGRAEVLASFTKHQGKRRRLLLLGWPEGAWGPIYPLQVRRRPRRVKVAVASPV